MFLSIYGLKLKNLLISKGYNEVQVDALIEGLLKKGDGFIFPYSEARILQMDMNEVRNMLIVLYSKGALNHYSIPKVNGEILFTFAQKGFISKFENLQDPEDFHPVDDDEVEVVSAYKLNPNV